MIATQYMPKATLQNKQTKNAKFDIPKKIYNNAIKNRPRIIKIILIVLLFMQCARSYSFHYFLLSSRYRNLDKIRFHCLHRNISLHAMTSATTTTVTSSIWIEQLLFNNKERAAIIQPVKLSTQAHFNNEQWNTINTKKCEQNYNLCYLKVFNKKFVKIVHKKGGK